MQEIEIEKNVFLAAEGIAVFKDLKLAVAADLHIGFEEALGQQLARVQTRMILEKFFRVMKRFEIKDVLLDGDIKYTFGKESKQEWREIEHFMSEILKRASVKIVKGNHDFYLENMVRDFDILVSKEFQINEILFTHGDEAPGDGKRKLVVIGNEHPSLKLRDEIGAVRKYPCFLHEKKEKILVLPAVNPWAPGTDVMRSNSAGFLSPALHAINLEEARLYPADGEEIYDFKKVKDVRNMLLKR
ncbi:Uncharacterised protein [uncultured archaeon]|nr:Uncharacterised protein [uncultured archaeon]